MEAFLVIYITVAVPLTIVSAIFFFFLKENRDDTAAIWARVFLFAPIWPIGVLVFIGYLFRTAYLFLKEYNDDLR